MDGTTFGQWLKQRRKALDITQEELASRVACSVWTIIKIEADQRRPSRDVALRLGQQLSLTRDEQTALVRWARVDTEVLEESHVPQMPLVEASALATPASDAAPFVVGPPIHQPQRFFGRTREISRAFGIWRQAPLQNVAVIGPRRSGKTSLLHHFRALTASPSADVRSDQRSLWERAPRQCRWVWVDFQDARLRRRERLLRHLLHGMGIACPDDCSLEHFLDAISDHLTEPTVILFDEIGAALNNAELDNVFWESLRSVASHATGGLLGFALSSHVHPALLAQDAGMTSPFFNIFGHTFQLGPLEPQAALALIESAPLPIARADRDWILEQSGGWPCLLQVCCYVALEALQGHLEYPRWREEARLQMQPFAYLLEHA